jgi:hypothetical protein
MTTDSFSAGPLPARTIGVGSEETLENLAYRLVLPEQSAVVYLRRQRDGIDGGLWLAELRVSAPNVRALSSFMERHGNSMTELERQRLGECLAEAGTGDESASFSRQRLWEDGGGLVVDDRHGVTLVLPLLGAQPRELVLSSERLCIRAAVPSR